MIELQRKIFNWYDICFKLLDKNRSLRRNFDLWLLKIQSLGTLRDVMVLTEVWIDDHELCLFQIPEYTVYAKCNSLYRAGGVVIIYVSDKIIVIVEKLQKYS